MFKLVTMKKCLSVICIMYMSSASDMLCEAADTELTDVPIAIIMYCKFCCYSL